MPRFVILLLTLPLMATVASARPDSPVTVSDPPEGQGAAFSPGFRPLPEDYVEEEFFVEGMADLYSYADPVAPVLGEVVPIAEDVPYKTRMIVRRPREGWVHNGTVVIEWWNTTATFDTAPVWDPSAEYFTRSKLVYVGFTNANQGLSHLTGGCSLFGLLPPTCGTRYASLSLPDDGLAYEIASQLAHLFKSDSPENPLPEDFTVRRVYQTGQSQQGGSVISYASNFHAEVNDGYFVQAASSARSVCGTGNVLPPGCTPQIPDVDGRRLRTDLPVPVYRALTENDVARGGPPQDDSEGFRYYEIAGTAHTTVHEDIEIIPAGVVGPAPIFLEDACLFPINSMADGPVKGSHMYNAMWENMEQTVKRGTPAPHGERIARDASGQILRDASGNALGGIRPTQIRVPLATYGPLNEANAANLPGPLVLLGNLFCVLSGTVAPFDAATLATLYPSHEGYVAQVTEAAHALMEQRFLLPIDAEKVIRAAERSSIGCGIGFELVFVLPPLLWLRRAVRGRSARSPAY